MRCYLSVSNLNLILKASGLHIEQLNDFVFNVVVDVGVTMGRS